MEIKHTYTVVDQSPKTEIRPVRTKKNGGRFMGFLHADLQLHSERFIAYFFSHINPKVVEGLETIYKPLLINSLGFKYISTRFNLLFLY